MGNILKEICDVKREHVAASKLRVSLAELSARIEALSEVRGFERALREKVAARQTAVIAEVKKASPSKGVIREDFDPVAIAEAYVRGGACCISVLTDEPYFQGADAYLTAVRAAVALPVLRKDFMLDTYQLYESRALGADCVLLIMAALSDDQAQELYQVARRLGMDVLVEVHDGEEMERAVALKASLIGVNNRNLKTLEVDISTTTRLAGMVPSTSLLICESGIKTRDDVLLMQEQGVYGFLIGESMMVEEDVEGACFGIRGGEGRVGE